MTLEEKIKLVEGKKTELEVRKKVLDNKIQEKINEASKNGDEYTLGWAEKIRQFENNPNKEDFSKIMDMLIEEENKILRDIDKILKDNPTLTKELGLNDLIS